MTLPVFEMIIEEDLESQIGVSFVALVDKPAIERNFLAFNDQKAISLNFAADIEKRVISGPAMVANSLIYRKDESGEYNVFFSKKTIEEIALKFFKMDYQKNLNLFHDPNLSLQGVTIFESFISDKDRGIQPMKGFEDLPDGTWFISCKVENEAIWEKVKSGEVKGFSVEGIFSYVKKPKTVEEQIVDLLNRTHKRETLLKETEIMDSVKDLVTKFKKTFFEEPVPPAEGEPAPPKEYELKDGGTVVIDRLEAGGVALIGDGPAPAGDYELADGTKFTVGEAGVIATVTPAMVPDTPPAEDEEMKKMKDAVAGFQAQLNQQKEDFSKLIADATAGFETSKAEFSNQLTTMNESFTNQLNESKQTIEKQDKIISGLVELVEKIADMPTATPPADDNRTSFSSDKFQKKEAKLKALTDSLSQLKKVK